VAIQIPASVAIGFSVLMVPLLDTLRVFSIRIINGRSPFTPDRNHVHHLFLDNGLSHSAVTFACVGINIGFIILAWLGRSLGTNYLLLVILSLAFVGLGFLYFSKSRRKMVVAKRTDGATELKKASKIVPLTQEAKQLADKN
jgi:UDP-N-acetylmuramyl pentapeptide phosphotransferase/UDP-N-acetylglucosamine-1-phosphate transferase